MKMSGYSDAEFEIDNALVDREMSMTIPDTWQDPNALEEAPKMKPPQDDKHLSDMAILVQSTGYKIVWD
jgi:hypothetical protein